jgi:hypothetical protein
MPVLKIVALKMLLFELARFAFISLQETGGQIRS